MPTVSKKLWDELVKKGLIKEPGNKGKKARKGVELVEASHPSPGVWVVPVKTASEINSRAWRARSSRTHDARRAVSRAFGPTLRDLVPFAEAFHRGGVLRVRLVRLGGAKMDRSNLPTALKATEDVLALLVGADDGADNWRFECDQEPGGAMGVRIELTAEGGGS